MGVQLEKGFGPFLPTFPAEDWASFTAQHHTATGTLHSFGVFKKCLILFENCKMSPNVDYKFVLGYFVPIFLVPKSPYLPPTRKVIGKQISWVYY